ncbi:MAG: hypothetical protein ACLPV8_28185 [Steroidobacteraceae bacterium]
MEIEARLRQLEFDYRAALSAAIVAKTNYFALAGDPSVLSAAVNRAKARWQQLDSRKQTLIAEMSELEELEHALSAD